MAIDWDNNSPKTVTVKEDCPYTGQHIGIIKVGIEGVELLKKDDILLNPRTQETILCMRQLQLTGAIVGLTTPDFLGIEVCRDFGGVMNFFEKLPNLVQRVLIWIRPKLQEKKRDLSLLRDDTLIVIVCAKQEIFDGDQLER